jgi:D-threo-aldose 1-dehydrogenase
MREVTLGRTGLVVPAVCVGTAPLGGAPAQYGHDVDERTAVATLLRAFEGPLRFLDSSNSYGGGNSERRIGLAIAEAGGVPPGVVIATKVDPLPGSRDFSTARMRQSVDESRERLGLDRLELVYLHDPEKISYEEGVGPDGPVRALIEMRDEGLIGHLGVAGGPIDLMTRYVASGVFDVVLSHNRFSLVDQSAEPLMDEAVRRGVAFVNAAPYGGGMLVVGPDKNPNYRYAPATDDTKDRVRQMQRILGSEGIPLAAAALQFSLNDDRVASTVIGMSAPERIDQTLELAAWPIPEAVWEQLEPFIRPIHRDSGA